MSFQRRIVVTPCCSNQVFIALPSSSLNDATNITSNAHRTFWITFRWSGEIKLGRESLKTLMFLNSISAALPLMARKHTSRGLFASRFFYSKLACFHWWSYTLLEPLRRRRVIQRDEFVVQVHEDTSSIRACNPSSTNLRYKLGYFKGGLDSFVIRSSRNPEVPSLLSIGVSS